MPGLEGGKDSPPDSEGSAPDRRKRKPKADPAVIDALFQEFTLAGTPVEDRLRVLIDEIQKDDVPEKYGRDIIHLLADCLSGVPAAAAGGPKFAADVGSGYGFPGLVLAASLDETEFKLLDFDPVRTAFLNGTAAKNWPVESWEDGMGRCDFVTFRNVSPLPTVIEWAAPLLRLGGTALFWARERDEVVEEDAKAAGEATGLRVAEVIRLSGEFLGGDTDRRHIHVYTKYAETPPEFPRARKAALKDPIRAEGGDRARTRWDEAVRKLSVSEQRKRASDRKSAVQGQDARDDEEIRSAQQQKRLALEAKRAQSRDKGASK
jgi:16S rRNA G527 N7-methylase RsmG